MKISCFIIDDEPLALEILESHIANVEDLHIVGKFNNAITAFQALQKTPVDLLFLDVQMPKLSGIDFLKSLANPPIVIFTTAYRKYAIAGYELDVTDYLLKPISFERFLQAIAKVYKQKSTPVQPKGPDPSDSYLWIQMTGKTIRVLINEILFIESQRDYSKIVTETRSITVHEKISDLEEKLRHKSFLRIHRSFLIAIDKIESWSTAEVSIQEHTLPIGRTYSSEVLKVLKSL